MKILKYKKRFILLSMIIFCFGIGHVANAAWETAGSWGGYYNEPSVAIDPVDDKPYVVFDRLVMKYVDVYDWQQVGNIVSSETVVSIKVNPITNEPYIVNVTSDGRLAVRRFSGGSWQLVGTIGSIVHAVRISLAFHPTTNEPYMSYVDWSNGRQITVMRYTGGSWQTVGSTGFSGSEYGATSMAFNPTTYEPYVAFGDYLNNQQISVIKFNGSSWETVGSAGFIAGNGISYHTSIAFDATNSEPYVSYNDAIMKFSDGLWQQVGDTEPNSIIAFDPVTNELNVAYKDSTLYDKFTVKKFSEGLWQIVGVAGINEEGSPYGGDVFSLVFNSVGEPYVGYLNDSYGQIAVMKYSNTLAITFPSLPTSTSTPTNITPTTAQGNGEITTTGNEDPERFIQWGTISGIYTDSCTAGIGGVGTYSCDLTNLTPNTIYYVQAYATNSAGTSYSTETSFTTSSPSQDTSLNISATIQETMTLSCGADIDLDNSTILIPETPLSNTTTCTVTTNDAEGYNLSVVDDRGASNTLYHETLSATIDGQIQDKTPWDPTGSGNAQAWSGTGLGFGILSSEATKNTTWWGTGDTCDDTDQLYAGFPITDRNIVEHTSYANTATDTNICYQVNVPTTQIAGEYTGSVTYTAVGRP